MLNGGGKKKQKKTHTWINCSGRQLLQLQMQPRQLLSTPSSPQISLVQAQALHLFPHTPPLTLTPATAGFVPIPVWARSTAPTQPSSSSNSSWVPPRSTITATRPGWGCAPRSERGRRSLPALKQEYSEGSSILNHDLHSYFTKLFWNSIYCYI